MKKNTPLTDWALLFLRVTIGGLMLVRHGWPKLVKLFTQSPIQFADPFHIGNAASLGLTVFAEFLCAFLVIIGLETRWATIPLSITMLVAAFVIHWPDPFKRKEFALIYLICFIFLAITGAGKYSLDGTLKKK